MERSERPLRRLRRRLSVGADLYREHGARRFLGRILPWFVCRRYSVYAKRLPGDETPLPESELSLTLAEAREEDFAEVDRLRPGFYERTEYEGRLRAGARCFLARAGAEPVHLAWVFTRELALDYFRRTVLLPPGQVYVDEVFSAPHHRRRGVHSRAGELLCRRLKDEGHRLYVFATPTWDEPVRRSARERGFKRIGEFVRRPLGDPGRFRLRRRPPPISDDARYRAFWEFNGENIPSHSDAPSTRYYRACEQLLFSEHFGELTGKRIFKTDLWDEAKNTRILKWAADRGARVFGLDISVPVAREARRRFAGSEAEPGFVASDLRRIAFADGSFDFLYSMGTIEHFDEYPEAVAECRRVLKDGGVAIIGVPNRCDPFLRPALISALIERELYPYGDEKAFSFRELERLLEDAGFEVLGRTGVLFVPGALRLLDLFFHVARPGLTALTAPLVRPFAWLYRTFPGLRKHGYLIASVVRKPRAASTTSSSSPRSRSGSET